MEERLELQGLNRDRIASNQLVSDSYNNLMTSYGRSNVQQLSPASPFIQTLTVLSELSELNFLYIENAISELNIATAKNADNIYGLARLTGHNPTRGISAKGKINLRLKHDYEDFDGTYLLIPKYSKIRCLNNELDYMLVPEESSIKIHKDRTVNIQCNIVQGQLETQRVISNGEPMQSYSIITNAISDHFDVTVTVNGYTYRQVNSLYDMGSYEKAVGIKTGINGGLDIYFGTGDFGYIPETGAQIEVTYIKTAGELGNLPSRENNVTFEFVDAAYNIYGEETDLNEVCSVTTLITPAFGANQEDPEFTRLIAPYTSKNFVLVNPDNYYYYLKKFNYFSVIRVFNTVNDQFKDDDNIVYLFLLPDIRKKLTSNFDYFSLNENEFIFTEKEVNLLRRVINESGQQLIGSELKFITPLVKKYVLNIVVSYYEGYNKDILKVDIRKKLNDYFINVTRRDIIPKADLIAILKNMEGIDSVNIFFISEENEKAMTDGFYVKKVFDYNPETKVREWRESKTIRLADGENPMLGLNEFGDILIEENDIPVIKGGWQDSNERLYEESVEANLSGLNIFFRNSVEFDLYVRENEINFKNLS